MKILFVIILLIPIFEISCNKIQICRSSSVSMDANVSDTCSEAITQNYYYCDLDSCLSYGCIDGTMKSFCNSIWDQLCCLEYVSIRKCSPTDYKIVLKVFDSLTRYVESVNCSQYPRIGIKCQRSYLNGGTSLLKSGYSSLICALLFIFYKILKK
jgi:hypothetical protein